MLGRPAEDIQVTPRRGRRGVQPHCSLSETPDRPFKQGDDSSTGCVVIDGAWYQAPPSRLSGVQHRRGRAGAAGPHAEEPVPRPAAPG